MTIQSTPHLPFKSVAAALLFSLILGPVGMLYSSFWGGVAMVFIGLVVVSSQLFFPIFLLWLFSCIFSVAAVEKYNRRLLASMRNAA